MHDSFFTSIFFDTESTIFLKDFSLWHSNHLKVVVLTGTKFDINTDSIVFM